MTGTHRLDVRQETDESIAAFVGWISFIFLFSGFLVLGLWGLADPKVR